jgi:copper chaperone
MSQVLLQIPSISCGHCARTIEEALAPLPGVRGVSVDIPKRQARVEHDDRLRLEQLEAVLQEQGYPATGLIRLTAEEAPAPKRAVGGCCCARR